MREVRQLGDRLLDLHVLGLRSPQDNDGLPGRWRGLERVVMLILVGAAWYVFSAAAAVATPPPVVALALDADTDDAVELDGLDDPQAATAILRPVAAKDFNSARAWNTRPLSSRLELCCMSLSSVLMGLVVSATWPMRGPWNSGPGDEGP